MNLKRNGKADGRFTIKGPGLDETPVPTEGSAYARALDVASRLDEPGSVNVREWGEIIAVARGDGAGGAYLLLGSASVT